MATIGNLNEQTQNINVNNDFLVVYIGEDTANGISTETKKIKLNTLLNSSSSASTPGAPKLIFGSIGTSPLKSSAYKNSPANSFNSRIFECSGMFTSGTTITGQIDRGININKNSGEDTVHINQTALSVGSSVMIDHPIDTHTSPASGKLIPAKVEVTIIDTDKIKIKSNTLVNVSFQVYGTY